MGKDAPSPCLHRPKACARRGTALQAQRTVGHTLLECQGEPRSPVLLPHRLDHAWPSADDRPCHARLPGSLRPTLGNPEAGRVHRGRVSPDPRPFGHPDRGAIRPPLPHANSSREDRATLRAGRLATGWVSDGSGSIPSPQSAQNLRQRCFATWPTKTGITQEREYLPESRSRSFAGPRPALGTALRFKRSASLSTLFRV